MVESQSQDPKPPVQIYDTDAVQFDTYLRVSRVEVVPDQGGGDLVEVRTEENDDRLWKSLRWHCRQDDAPKAGEVFHLLLIKPNYAVMDESIEPQPPTDPED